MSKIVSIDLTGKFINNKTIMDCLRQPECKFVFNNELALGFKEDDDITVNYYSISKDDDHHIDAIIKKWPDIITINVAVNVGEWIQWITLFLDQENKITLTLQSDIKESASGFTDFSWYMDNLVPVIINDVFKITSVCCEEHI